MSNSSDSSDDEFFDCTEPFPSKFYAVAVPPSSPGAGLFANISQAKSRLKSVKGSRLKAFESIQDASNFSARPILDTLAPTLSLPEGEAIKFPAVKQADLLRFRKYIEANDLISIKKCIEDNPMYLLTGCDTPTILQLVFRFNAIHIAAKSGNPEVIKLIISYLESPDFWARIYPNASVDMAEERQRRVLDLYLNSPETGSLSSALHLASKFGHVECVRVLASHPGTLLDLRDASGATALDTVCNRLLVDECLSLEEKALRRQAIVRALDERYVVLVDRSEARGGGVGEAQPTVLPESLMGRQLHHLLSVSGQLSCPGITEFCPYLTAHRPPAAPLTPPPAQTRHSPPLPFSPRRAVSPPPPSLVAAFHSPSAIGAENVVSGGPADLRAFGATGQLVRIRAILGPLDTEEARHVVAVWRRPRNPFWTNIRLMDAEKGYERYGRRLARELKTKWTEHWTFLDDFADLRSAYGLGLLNDYLGQFYTSVNKPTKSLVPSPISFPCKKINFDESVEESTPKKTPTKRVKCERNVISASLTNEGHLWTTYREDNNPEHVLSDSLEESSSLSQLSSNSLAEIENDPKCQASKQMSPVIGLLNNFIVSSPLRFILPPSCAGGGSPTISRPEKRISMFSRSEDVVNTSPRCIATPLRKTPAASRRHVIEGVWPSLLEQTPEARIHMSHLQASITTAEISAHNALSDEVAPDEKEGQNEEAVDDPAMENFLFVKRWKREIDLSIHLS